MSVRQEIIAEVRSRLGAISVVGGFQTDAGVLVLVGQAPSFGPDDPTAVISISISDDESFYQGEKVTVVLPLEVHALVKADLADPYLAAEAVIADIKKAVEKPGGVSDHDLGGLAVPRGLARGVTKAALREPGSEYVAARVEYRITYAEMWGNP